MTTTNADDLRVVLAKLREPFPPEVHVERALPGGGKWFFVRWQDIRDRLDDVWPGWEVTYSTPEYTQEYCIVKCTLTLCGVSREAWGNAEIGVVGKTRGTAIERAIADAFKNAAEAFGVAAYLDDQSKEKREFTLKYLHKAGDGRAVKNADENGWTPRSVPTRSEKVKRAAQEEHDRAAAKVATHCISDAQAKRLWAIAKSNGWDGDGLKAFIQAALKIESSKLISVDKYEWICEAAGNPVLAKEWNNFAAKQNGQMSNLEPVGAEQW